MVDVFYLHVQAELGGKRGLVPSNFLEELKIHRNDGSVEVFAADEEALRRAEEIIQKVCAVEGSHDQFREG